MNVLKYHKGVRKHLRSTVTRIYNDIDNFETYDVNQLETTKVKLTKLQSDLRAADATVTECMYTNAVSEDQVDLELEQELIACEAYQDRINEALQVLVATTSAVAAPPAQVLDPTPRSLLKSPTAPLPKFSSEVGENFELFLRNFEDTLSKYNFTAYDKFLLLKGQISGKALYLIESLDPTNQTYDQAKQLLTQALASRDLQISNVLTQMLEMRLTYNSEPFKYVADMRKLVHACRDLKITIEEVLQYFFLKGMNETFKNQLVLVTNSSTPTLDQILDNFFVANDRYTTVQQNYRRTKAENFSKNKENYKTVSALKTETVIKNSSNPFIQCSLCTNNKDHSINKCPVFKTPRSKIERLERIKGCVLCTNSDHAAENCNFRFKRCCHLCKEWHFSFVCPKPQESSLPNGQQFNFSTKNSLVLSNNFPSGGNLDSVLSTLTCTLPNNVEVRALRDSGSQSNF